MSELSINIYQFQAEENTRHHYLASFARIVGERVPGGCLLVALYDRRASNRRPADGQCRSCP